MGRLRRAGAVHARCVPRSAGGGRHRALRLRFEGGVRLSGALDATDLPAYFTADEAPFDDAAAHQLAVAHRRPRRLAVGAARRHRVSPLLALLTRGSQALRVVTRDEWRRARCRRRRGSRRSTRRRARRCRPSTPFELRRARAPRPRRRRVEWDARGGRRDLPADGRAARRVQRRGRGARDCHHVQLPRRRARAAGRRRVCAHPRRRGDHPIARGWRGRATPASRRRRAARRWEERAPVLELALGRRGWWQVRGGGVRGAAARCR